MSRSRNSRYYDDSDDMVERIRRAREAFDKKANAFQGPDWPYYDKRDHRGKKTKEECSGGAGPGRFEAAVDPCQLRNYARIFATRTMCPKMPR